MTKGEKIIRREEKRLEKERKRSIQEANKMLIPTPKQTQESLKILSFDPSGTFRLEKNRWIKVYEIIGENEGCDGLKNLNGRARITEKIEKGKPKKRYLTLMEEGEIYKEVQKDIEMDQLALEKRFLLKPLSIDETMNVVGEGRMPFSYAAMVRGKKDWKEAVLLDVKEEKDSFKVGDLYAQSMCVLEFPSIHPSSLFCSLEEIGCSMSIVFDIQTTDLSEGFLQTLEKRYNRRLKRSEEEMLNLSCFITYFCDSEDAREIIEKTIKRMFSRSGFTLATAYGAQRNAYESAATLGILDYSNMRNVKAGGTIWQ